MMHSFPFVFYFEGNILKHSMIAHGLKMLFTKHLPKEMIRCK